MSTPLEPQGPIFVASDKTAFSAICDYCVAEKNALGGAGWTRDEAYDDVTVAGEIPLEENKRWVKCPRGHDHLVLRVGSEEAESFL